MLVFYFFEIGNLGWADLQKDLLGLVVNLEVLVVGEELFWGFFEIFEVFIEIVDQLLPERVVGGLSWGVEQ